MLLRVGVLSEKHSFRKEPYSSRQLATANYATVRESFMFTYNADFKKAIGKNDLTVNIISRGPQNVTNFFGVGNETTFINPGKEGISLYRNRFDVVDADIRLGRSIGKNFRLTVGPRGEYYTSSASKNAGRFLTTYNAIAPDEDVFSERWFAGFITGAEFDSRNDNLFPSKGMHWITDFTAMKRLNGDKKGYGRLYSDLSFYIPIVKDSILVLANRVGGGTTTGSPLFYQQMRLGGAPNVRGYNTNRFTGQSMVFHNAELRLKLFDFTSYLFPGTVGLIAFNDVGRVWVPNETSNRWHHSVGGGVYIVPAELIVIQAVVARSVERTLPYISLGFRF
jgi:outer membrane protein assembly factor BamA